MSVHQSKRNPVTVDSLHAIRLGMIGCGYISHAHGRAAKKSRQHIQFVACASRNREHAETWGEAYQCERVYSDHTEMLEKEDLHGVVICTLPSLHRQHIMESITRDIRYILCEKPLTVSGRDAIDIFTAAEKAKAVVLEAYMYRYHPAIEKMRELVTDEEVGKIDHVQANFHMPLDNNEAMDNNWRYQAEAGGGIALDFTCYPVDAGNVFIGSLPVSVFAYGSRHRDRDVLNRLYGEIQYENGVVMRVGSSWQASFSQSLEITCARAGFRLDTAWSIPGKTEIIKTSSPQFLVLDVEKHSIPDTAQHDGRLIDFPVFTRQLEHFADVIKNNTKPSISPGASILNAVIIDALLKSVEDGGVVRVRAPDIVKKALI